MYHKKNSIFIFIVCFSIYTINGLNAQEKYTINYFESVSPPSDSAVVFAKGMISTKDHREEKISFTSDGKECFFGRHHDAGDNYFKPRVRHSKYQNKRWSEPDTAIFSKKRIVGYPVLNGKGTLLLMEQPINPTPKGVTGRIVFSKKEKQGWSKIDSIIPEVKAQEGFGLAQMTNDSVLYFHDRFHRIAYCTKMSKGKYKAPQKLPYRINPCVEFFVSPENDYIIFKPINWQNQFHISFRNKNMKWSMPLPFNKYFKKHKLDGYGPYVSPDKKYFFFGKAGDIYWVKTDFIAELRKQAFY